ARGNEPIGMCFVVDSGGYSDRCYQVQLENENGRKAIPSRIDIPLSAIDDPSLQDSCPPLPPFTVDLKLLAYYDGKPVPISLLRDIGYPRLFGKELDGQGPQFSVTLAKPEIQTVRAAAQGKARLDFVGIDRKAVLTENVSLVDAKRTITITL